MKPAHFVTITKNGSNPAYRGARSGVDRLARQLGVLVPPLPQWDWGACVRAQPVSA
jgi:hypothetical protein